MKSNTFSITKYLIYKNVINETKSKLCKIIYDVVNLDSDYAYVELEKNRFFNRAEEARGETVWVSKATG